MTPPPAVLAPSVALERIEAFIAERAGRRGAHHDVIHSLGTEGDALDLTLSDLREVVATLRASLAQQWEAKPVAEVVSEDGAKHLHFPDSLVRFLLDSPPGTKLFAHPAAVDVVPEDRVDVALAAYNRADYQWVQRDKDDRDEPRHRFAMRAAVAALLPATSEGENNVDR